MEQFEKYVKENAYFLDFTKEYDIEENYYYYESSMMVLFNSQSYSTKLLSFTKPIYNPYNILLKKICKKIRNEPVKKYTILHRGNYKDFQENSFEGLEYAVKNYDGFETDIRLTSDNYWIVNHDKDCKRIHKKTLVIKDTTLTDILLQTNIITLKKLLFTNIYTNKLINIEIKDKFEESNILSKNSLINILKKFKNKIIVSSFDWNWCKFIESNNLNFAHLITSLEDLPKNSNKIIVSKKDYETLNCFNDANLQVYGVYGITFGLYYELNIELIILDL